VRAIWAGVPFLWQAYPQQDGAHVAKVEAMLEALAAPAPVAAPLAAAWRAWNGTEQAWHLPPLQPWAAAVRAWRGRLAAAPDLVSQLLAFASTHRAGAG
jgi:hypothetical protein